MSKDKITLYKDYVTTECVGLVSKAVLPYSKILNQDELIITLDNMTRTCKRIELSEYTSQYGDTDISFDNCPFYIASTLETEETATNILYVPPQKTRKYFLKIEYAEKMSN